MATGNRVPENFQTLTPVIQAPISDTFSVPLSQQGRICGFFESQFFRCMEAYGAKLGRKYCDLEHRDYQECITGDKQKKRAEAIAAQRTKLYMQGSNKAMMEPEDELSRRMQIDSCTHQVWLVRRRELGHFKPGTQPMRCRRDFFRTVPLDHSVELPHSSELLPVAFSPDGRLLISFSRTLRVVYIHKYKGVERAIGCTPDSAFVRVAPIVCEMPLTGPYLSGVSLVKDFCLWTEDSNHMLLCASAPNVSENVNVNTVYRNNESLHLGPGAQSLEKYVFISVDVKSMEHRDTYVLSHDRVNVAQGVTIRGRTVCILSWQHQTIHVLYIKNNGKLLLLRTVGPSVHDDDEIYLKSELINFGRTTYALSGFKQRLFTFLYNKCKREGNMSVHMFHRITGVLRKLKLSRIHMLDDTHLFIRLAEVPDTRQTSSSALNIPFFCVIFNWKLGTVLHVFQVSEFLDRDYINFYFNFAEELTTYGGNFNPFPCSVSRCPPVNESFRRDWHEIERLSPEVIFAKYDYEVFRRLLYTLPWGCVLQSRVSPYLDPTLFRLPGRSLHSILRGRLTKNFMLNWMICTKSQTQLLFSINPMGESSHQALLFHPEHPFALSFDKGDNRLRISFHLPSGCQRDEF